MVEIKGKSRKTETFVCHQNPLGVPVFFWRSRAMQPSDRVFDRDFSTPSSTDSAAVQDQRLGSSLVFDTIFTIFCSGLRWETYESVVLCSFFLKGRGACLNPPHRWLCVEQWLLRPDSHRRRAQEGKRAVASEQKTWKKFLVPCETRHLMCVDSIRVHAQLCFCFHLLPCHHSLVFAHGKAASECCKTKIKTVRRKERKALSDSEADPCADYSG